jgi:hypothetical protein
MERETKLLPRTSRVTGVSHTEGPSTGNEHVATALSRIPPLCKQNVIPVQHPCHTFPSPSPYSLDEVHLSSRRRGRRS